LPTPCFTTAAADDPLLVHWVKEAAPFIGVPPPNMNLTGWRDPFVVERPCDANDHEWVVLMGSGALLHPERRLCIIWLFAARNSQR
jgi:beta-fructofuranosidase